MPSIYTASGPKIEGSTQRVFLAFPVGSGMFPPEFVINLATSVSALTTAGIEHDICILSGNCHVDDARNALVRQFRMSQCTDFHTIDADMGWESSDLVKILGYDEDIVVGPYRYKHDEEDYPILPVPGSEFRVNSGLLMEVEGAPTGFMRVKRHVIERLAEVHKEHHFFERHHKAGKDLETVILFERGMFDKAAGARFSGDYRFCRLARAEGFRVWIDPEMYFEHVGPKAWGGRLADHWRTQNNIPHPEFMKAVQALKDGQETGETFATLVHYWGNPLGSLTPESLAALYYMAVEAKGPMLETGSGLSTIVLGVAAARAGVKVHTLEHDLDWRDKTLKALTRYGLSSVCLWHLPLVEQEEASGKFTWYDMPMAFRHLDDLDLVLCDGPQRRFGRDGLFRLLGDKMSDARIILDDADTELPIISEWAVENGREFKVMGTERPFAVSLPTVRMVASSAA